MKCPKVAIALLASALFVMMGLWAPSAWAHRPIFSSPPAHTSAESALQLPDIDISRAIYRTAPEAEPFWVIIHDGQGAMLRVQLGVPQIERLERFRPRFILIGPGLPNRDPLPSEIEAPSDVGAAVFHTTPVEAPRVFHEEITGTTSWVLFARSFRLPQTGPYQLVVHVNGPGKYWLSVGEREAFGVADIARVPYWTDRVRSFHEIDGWPAWLLVTTIGLTLLVLGAIWIGVRSL